MNFTTQPGYEAWERPNAVPGPEEADFAPVKARYNTGICWQEAQPQVSWTESYYSGLAVPASAEPKPPWSVPVGEGQRRAWSGVVTQGLLFLVAHQFEKRGAVAATHTMLASDAPGHIQVHAGQTFHTSARTDTYM